jgi:hypothetical protein
VHGYRAFLPTLGKGSNTASSLEAFVDGPATGVTSDGVGLDESRKTRDFFRLPSTVVEMLGEVAIAEPTTV